MVMLGSSPDFGRASPLSIGSSTGSRTRQERLWNDRNIAEATAGDMTCPQGRIVPSPVAEHREA